LLRDRNVRRVVLARFISRTGGEAAFFVGIWGKAAYEFEGTAADIALVIAALGLSGLVGGAIAGALIDRFDPRKVLLGSEVLFVPATLAFLLADDLIALVAVSVIFGLVSSPTFTSIAAFPPFLTDDEVRLGRINAVVETAGMAALISGTAAGALLAEFVSIDSIFVFDAITSLVAVALVARVRVRQMNRDAGESRGGLEEVREGFRYSFRHERVRFYLLVGASVWLLFGLFSALEPLFFRDVLGRGPETIGWVNTLFGVGLVTGTVGAARLPQRWRSARAVLVLMALNGIGSAVYVGTSNLVIVVAGGMVWGFVIGLFAPLVRTLLHLNSPEALMGRITSVAQVMGEVAKLGPLVLAPALAAAFGVQLTMAVSGSVLSLLALVAWRTGRSLDETRQFSVESIETGTVADEPITPVP
jgi:predicted MFS family arabinose efflux permease